MAKYVVPPKKLKMEVLLKCYKCGCLYAPEGKQKGYLNYTDYEDCPVCGYSHNSAEQAIPLWRYNIIKWFRGGFKK